MNQLQTGITLSVALLASLAGTAKADFFSFASDRNGQGPIFQGVGATPPASGGINDASALNPGNRVNTQLLWDADQNGPNPAVVIPAYFTFQASLSNPAVAPIGGGFLESWTATGQYEFRDPANNAVILRVQFNNAAFVSFSDSQGLLGETATLQSSGATDSGLTFTGFGPLAGRDFSTLRTQSFTLTALRGAQGGRAPINQGGFILPGWVSEGSWSASAVPAPGALALGGLGGLLIFRRERKSR
ncbi:MAG: hypothetical protein WC718_14480 [Phycisphaerales bacterium]|jgi:hypothetical protein